MANHRTASTVFPQPLATVEVERKIFIQEAGHRTIGVAGVPAKYSETCCVLLFFQENEKSDFSSAFLNEGRYEQLEKRNMG